MLESKIALTERLRREGRWDEASKFKDNAINGFRTDGMKRGDAAEAAWAAMADAFPPMSVGERPIETRNGTLDSSAAESGPIPWNDLPTQANFDEEVRWVHQQYILIIEDSSQGVVIHWDRATTDAPSTGACSLARWAAENRTAFYKDLLPKTMARSNGLGDTENTVKVQDPGLREIKAMLKQLEQDRDAEMHDNVPKVLQKRINEMLAKWWQQYEVSLVSDARRQLESGICELIYEGLRACTASPAEK